MMVGFSFRKHFLCISALVVMALGAFDARAERTVVSGVAKSYAGKELALKCFSDQIVYTERLLANSVVDESGNFTFVVDVFACTGFRADGCMPRFYIS
jgi:transposase-like protein